MKTSISILKQRSALAAIIVIIVLALLPMIGVPQTFLLYFFLFYAYLAMANMWNLLAGYCGLISLCQPAFLGIAGGWPPAPYPSAGGTLNCRMPPTFIDMTPSSQPLITRLRPISNVKGRFLTTELSNRFPFASHPV